MEKPKEVVELEAQPLTHNPEAKPNQKLLNTRKVDKLHT